MATEMLNVRKKYSKIFFSEVIRGIKMKLCINVCVIVLYINCVFYCSEIKRGMKLKLCINVCVIVLYINCVFIAVAHVVLLLWQL